MGIDLGAENRRGGEHGARSFKKAASGKGDDVRIADFGLWIGEATISGEFTPPPQRLLSESCGTCRNLARNVRRLLKIDDLVRVVVVIQHAHNRFRRKRREPNCGDRRACCRHRVPRSKAPAVGTPPLRRAIFDPLGGAPAEITR